MTKEEQERIEGEAKKYIGGGQTWVQKGYIAGATHERSLMEKEKIELINKIMKQQFGMENKDGQTIMVVRVDEIEALKL